jgi:hypothetical protein
MEPKLYMVAMIKSKVSPAVRLRIRASIDMAQEALSTGEGSVHPLVFERVGRPPQTLLQHQ